MTTETRGALSEKLTVLVCSCDAYEDLWTPFFTLLHKYWPDLPCRVVLNTETKDCNGQQFPVASLHPDDPAAPYGQRMRECLARIETPYTLLLLDDFFLRAPADTQKISDIVTWMEAEPNIASVNFDWNNARTDEEGAVPGFYLMPQFAMYKLNMQAGVWRTDRLLHYWQRDDDPWRWELFVNYLTFDRADVFCEAGCAADAPIQYGLCKTAGWGVVSGKWAAHDVAPLFAANGITVDYTKRGICSPDYTPSLVPVNAKTIRYMLSRIGVRYTVGLLWFTAVKRFRKKLGLPLKHMYYPELLTTRSARRRKGGDRNAV